MSTRIQSPHGLWLAAALVVVAVAVTAAAVFVWWALIYAVPYLLAVVIGIVGWSVFYRKP